MRTGNTVNTRGKGPNDARLLQLREQMRKWSATLKADWAGVINGIKTAYCGDAPGDRTARHKARAIFIAGVLGLFAWPLLCQLNLVVLSQIMELFCPTSASPWFLPGLGSVEPMALLLAGIIAVAEVIFSVAAWEGDGAFIRSLAAFAWLAAVGFEVYGAWLRGQILGAADGGGTLGLHAGIVSALIGFVAPAAESVASILCFGGVLKPLGLTGLRLPRMLHHWMSLCIYGLRYRTMHAVWIMPEVAAQQYVVQQVARDCGVLQTAAQNATKAAEPIKRAWLEDDGESAVDPETIMRKLEEHDRIAQEVVETLRPKLLNLAKSSDLTAPLPTIAWAVAARDAIVAARTACQRRARDLDANVRKPANVAHAAAKAKLQKLALALPQECPGLPDSVTISRMQEQADTLFAERQAILAALEHGIASDTFAAYASRSQERNLGIVSDLLIALDGGEKKAVIDAADLAVRRQQIIDDIRNRQGTPIPPDSPLHKVGAAVANTVNDVGCARTVLTLLNRGGVIEAAPADDVMQAEIEQALTALLNQVSDMEEDLRNEVLKADKRLRAFTPWGQFVSWLTRIGSDRSHGKQEKSEQNVIDGAPVRGAIVKRRR